VLLDAPARAKETPVKKLYVGNLPFQAAEEDVQALFSENGITSGTVTLIRDRFTGQPRGFGFVEINDDGEAEKAVAALNGKDFKGRKIVVNEARPQREGGGGGGGGRGPGGGGGGRGGYGGGGGRGGRGGGRDR
jgi:cold-inducible RNA-binding protein